MLIVHCTTMQAAVTKWTHNSGVKNIKFMGKICPYTQLIIQVCTVASNKWSIVTNGWCH